MSNLPVAAAQIAEWTLLTAVAAALIVIAAIVLRRGSVVGPPRLSTHEPISTLLGLTIVGIGAWVLIPSIYGASIQARNAATQPATTPATQPLGVTFTARQTVSVSIVGAFIVSAILIGGNLLLRPGGLNRLGFSLRSLPRGLLWGALAVLFIIPLTLMLAVLTDRLWDLVGLRHPGAHEMLRMLGAAEQDRALRWLIYASAIVAAPLFEELLFRGHVQTLMVYLFGSSLADDATFRSMPRWLAIVITSGLFAFVHGAVWMMPPIFFLSLCIGYVYERTANLWSAIVIHLLFNVTNVVLFVHLASR